MRKPSLLIIFLTVFIDLIGFGIVMPLLPLYSRDFGATGWMNGAIVASFSLMQFIFAPWWGRLSDRIGRRPVLLISNFGSAIAYAGFGYASTFQGSTALWFLLASRVFAGIAGAELLSEKGATEVYVAATHGVFSGPAIDRLKNAPISKVVVTNTLPLPPEKQIDKIEVLSVAGIIADAIDAVFEDTSVSEIFGGANLS